MSAYGWPVEDIRDALDKGPSVPPAPSLLMAQLKEAGYGPSLIDFLAPLYGVADGASLYKGAIRFLPFEGGDGWPSLVEWNLKADWKLAAPAKAADSFFFMANAFGDLFGIPVAQGEISRDRVAVVWVEKGTYEESQIGWQAFMTQVLRDENSMASYIGRLKEYKWATKHLGKPALRQCYSWNLPPVLGGEAAIDNLSIVGMGVGISFTLQAIAQARGKPAKG